MTDLETARLVLRSWREDDLNAYARICADPEGMRYLSGTMTRDQAAQQMERWMSHWEERGFGVWVAQEKASGAFIGFIGLLYHEEWPEGEHKTEVGWRLDRSFWGRGLGYRRRKSQPAARLRGAGAGAHHRLHLSSQKGCV